MTTWADTLKARLAAAAEPRQSATTPSPTPPSAEAPSPGAPSPEAPGRVAELVRSEVAAQFEALGGRLEALWGAKTPTRTAPSAAETPPQAPQGSSGLGGAPETPETPQAAPGAPEGA